MSVNNQLVHPARTKGRGHSIYNHFTRIDVADYLGFPLRCVSALLQEDDRCWLGEREREREREGERGREKQVNMAVNV